MKFASGCGLALLLLVGGTAKAQHRDDYEVTCRQEVANRFGVKKHEVRTQSQGEEYGKIRVRWTYNQRNGVCEYDSRMNLMAFREFGENSDYRYDNRDGNRHGDDNYHDRQPVLAVYPVRADTSGRGTFSGGNRGSVRITRGWVDTTGEPIVALSGEHNFKITFRGEAVRANGDRVKSNQVFGPRNAENQYLLRGLIKCGLCNLTYVGMTNRDRAQSRMYYRCNGKQNARGIYGERGQRCPSKDVRGEGLEELIWADVEAFLRDPGPVLQQLQKQLGGDAPNAAARVSRPQLEANLNAKDEERARVLALFRRGRISDAELDAQLDEIAAEEDTLRRSLAGLDGARRERSPHERISGVRWRASQPIADALGPGRLVGSKRELVEVLVGQIRVEGAHRDERERPVVRVMYKFPSTTVTCTGIRASNCCQIERVIQLPDPRLPSAIRTVGDQIRVRRLTEGLTQAQLAQMIGVTETAVGQWEGNKRAPSQRFLPAISSFVGGSPASSFRQERTIT